MERLRTVRAGFCALALVLLAACAGGGASAPAFNTGGTTPAGTVSASPSTLTFPNTGSSFAQTINITTNAPTSTITVNSTSCGSGASAIVTFGAPAGSGESFTDTITPVNPGSCTATVTSSQGGSATLNITVV